MRCCRSDIPTAGTAGQASACRSTTAHAVVLHRAGDVVPAATNLPNAGLNGLFAGYGATAPVSDTINLGFNDDGTLFTQTGAINYRGPNADAYRVIAGNVRMPVASTR